MKREPITNHEFYGCSNCSSITTYKQNKNEPYFIGYDYGLHCIYFYEKDKEDYTEALFLEEHFRCDEDATLKLIEEKFIDKFMQYDFIEVDFISAFRGEVYEYNKEDQEWYLVEQNKGWA